jgi:hypothetical protein
MDLFDYFSHKLSKEGSIEAVLAVFYAQVDGLRDLTKVERFKLRDNNKLTQKVMSELHKSKPNFQIYRVMDDIQFVDEASVIPMINLKDALRKAYPYADEQTLNLFLNLCDVNSDNRLEVSEILAFLAHVDPSQTTGQSVLNKLASIVASTDEDLSTFLSLHQLDPASLSGARSFLDLADLLVKVFRLSRYESFLAFKHLCPQGQSKLEMSLFMAAIDA